MRKVIVYISMSLDGFLAGPDDSIEFLDSIDHGDETYGYNDFVAGVDTYIVGNKTYQVVTKLTGGEFPQKDQFDCYVLTRNPDHPPVENITFYSGDINELIENIKLKPGKNIYCDGGAAVFKLFLENNLVDKLIVAVIPIIIGKGTRLFLESDVYQKVKLMNSKSYENGLVQLEYDF